MKKLNFPLLILLLLLIQIHILPQTKTENKDKSLNKNSVVDSLIINNFIKEKLSNVFLAPLLYNFNPEIPLRTRKQSLKLYLLNKNYEHHVEELKYGRFINLKERPAEYLFLVQQQEDLFNGLKKMNKNESAELEFIRKYLGVSEDIAAIIIMIIHLSKNQNSPFP